MQSEGGRTLSPCIFITKILRKVMLGLQLLTQTAQAGWKLSCLEEY